MKYRPVKAVAGTRSTRTSLELLAHARGIMDHLLKSPFFLPASGLETSMMSPGIFRKSISTTTANVLLRRVLLMAR